MSVLRENNKVDGEWSEMVFQCEATKRGFILSKPFGDNQAYDFLLDNGRGIVRVQVKSTNTVNNNGTGGAYRYRVDMYHSRNKLLYTKDEIDMFAVYIIPDDAWYFIPVEEVDTTKCSFYPHLTESKGKFESYKNYWEIFDHYGN